MNAGDGASGFGAFASDAKNELRNNMVELAFLRQLVYLLLNFWGFKIFNRHT
jgi:hypothetical protein